MRGPSIPDTLVIEPKSRGVLNPPHARRTTVFVGWAKARLRRAHHLCSIPKLVGTLRFAHPTISLRRLRRLAKYPCRRRKPARRAIRHLDLILPRQTKCSRHHVLHEGIRTIHRAAFHRDIAAVPELVDVVLDAPVD